MIGCTFKTIKELSVRTNRIIKDFYKRQFTSRKTAFPAKHQPLLLASRGKARMLSSFNFLASSSNFESLFFPTFD